MPAAPAGKPVRDNCSPVQPGMLITAAAPGDAEDFLTGSRLFVEPAAAPAFSAAPSIEKAP